MIINIHLVGYLNAKIIAPNFHPKYVEAALS